MHCSVSITDITEFWHHFLPEPKQAEPLKTSSRLMAAQASFGNASVGLDDASWMTISLIPCKVRYPGRLVYVHLNVTLAY